MPGPTAPAPGALTATLCDATPPTGRLQSSWSVGEEEINRLWMICFLWSTTSFEKLPPITCNANAPIILCKVPHSSMKPMFGSSDITFLNGRIVPIFSEWQHG